MHKNSHGVYTNPNSEWLENRSKGGFMGKKINIAEVRI